MDAPSLTFALFILTFILTFLLAQRASVCYTVDAPNSNRARIYPEG